MQRSACITQPILGLWVVLRWSNFFVGDGVYRGAVMTLRIKPYGYKKDHIHGAALWRHHVKVVETY